MFEPNRDHRSSPFLILNKRGQTALAQLGEAAAGHHAALARRLAGADVGAIRRGLRRLIQALDDPPSTK
jgi:hypothetical protein